MHEALVYDTDTRFVDVLAPFVADGVSAGDQVCVVSRPSNMDLLRDAIGPDGGQVSYIDATEWYSTPARTIAGYHRTIRAARAAGAARIRVVGEVEFGDTEAEHAAWTRYESILNAAFADDPAWIICPYDARRLPARVVEDARRTHSHDAVEPGAPGHNKAFVDPHMFVAPLPLVMRGAVVAEIEFALDCDLRQVRKVAGRAGTEAGLSAERAAELVIVVSELATNALVHGRSPARLRACRDDRALTLEVSDGGDNGLEPMAGFRPPVRNTVGGVGLWISRQLADHLEIVPEPNGTTVRIRFDVGDPVAT